LAGLNKMIADLERRAEEVSDEKRKSALMLSATTRMSWNHGAEKGCSAPKTPPETGGLIAIKRHGQ